LLGGNLGDRKGNFEKAQNMISNEVGEIKRGSSLYETEPWGFKHEKNFLNQLIQVETSLNPEDILIKISKIEKCFKKDKGIGEYLPREIDIDILFYNNEIIKKTSIEIPHPRIHLRKFVLEPLCELIPDYIHPVFGIPIRQLRENCADGSWVRKIM
jgi:2-amino-4-hydroxy-6-hydroxymethyldihydropteridine diphosphokinase